MSVILLVEDYQPVRVSTANALRSMGCRVLEADCAELAMAILQREPVDILFTDVALPGVSGDVFAAEASSLMPNLKVVFGTGLLQFSPSDARDGPTVLRKPYTLESLEAALGVGSPASDRS